MTRAGGRSRVLALPAWCRLPGPPRRAGTVARPFKECAPVRGYPCVRNCFLVPPAFGKTEKPPSGAASSDRRGSNHHAAALRPGLGSRREPSLPCLGTQLLACWGEVTSALSTRCRVPASAWLSLKEPALIKSQPWKGWEWAGEREGGKRGQNHRCGPTLTARGGAEGIGSTEGCIHPGLNKIQLSLTHLLGSKRAVPISPFATSSLGYLHLSNANGEPVLWGMFWCPGCDLPRKGTTTLGFSPPVSGTCDQWFLPVIFLPEGGSGVHSSVTPDPRMSFGVEMCLRRKQRWIGASGCLFLFLRYRTPSSQLARTPAHTQQQEQVINSLAQTRTV